MLLLITYLSAMETLICHREMSLIGSTSLGFAQNTIHDFQNTISELIVALSSTNATKIVGKDFLLFLQSFQNAFPSESLHHYQTTNFRLFQTERVCRRQFQI